MEENVAKELPGEVNPGMLTPLRSMSNGLWSCQMLSSSLGGRLFFLPLVSKLKWIAFEMPFYAEIRIEPWDYPLKVRRRNAGTYWYLSVSVTVTSAQLTLTVGCRDPPNGKSPRSARTVEPRKDQRRDECCLFSPLSGPCSGAVNIPPRWCADSCWCEIGSFRCCSEGCHLCLFIILNATNAVLSVCLKERQDVTCRPCVNQPAAKLQKKLFIFGWLLLCFVLKECSCPHL